MRGSCQQFLLLYDFNLCQILRIPLNDDSHIGPSRNDRMAEMIGTSFRRRRHDRDPNEKVETADSTALGRLVDSRMAQP